MKVRPLHDRILVKRVDPEESVRGGIIIPDTAKEKPMEAEVVAVGSGKVLSDGKIIYAKPGWGIDQERSDRQFTFEVGIRWFF